jgi:hypothetical protein
MIKPLQIFFSDTKNEQENSSIMKFDDSGVGRGFKRAGRADKKTRSSLVSRGSFGINLLLTRSLVYRALTGRLLNSLS